MATLKLTILKAKKLKDGRHRIRIALCHRQETCYIITRFSIDNESQFKNGQVVKRADASVLNTKLRNLLNLYQERLDKIESKSLYNCTQLKNLILRECDSINNIHTFQSVCREYVAQLDSLGRKGYANLMRSTNIDFTRFTNGEIMLKDITPYLIQNYSIYLKKKKLASATIGIAMRNVKTIINLSIKKRLIKYDVHPFIDYEIPSSSSRENDISLESFNKIRLAAIKDKKLRVSRDLFCLSFYMGGMNLIDLLSADLSGDEVSYIRAKSKNTTSGQNITTFSIPVEAKKIISHWINKNGRLDFGYKFSYSNFSRYVSRNLKILCKRLEIKENVVFYSARKTFAQIASEIGVSDAVIDYCLGHSDKKRGVIRFYTKIRKQQADVAINSVAEYINNPTKYKDIINMKKLLISSMMI